MPTYKFSCPNQHDTEMVSSMSSRPSSIDCPDCSEIATQRPNWAPAPRPHRFGTNKWIHIKSERTDRLYHYSCELEHDTDEWFENPPDEIECQQKGCSLVAKKSIGANIETFWLQMEREGGYYDQSLGMQIHTEAQRKAEAKKRGLTIVDGDFDVAAATYEGRKQQEELQVGYRDYHDRVHNDPAYADARAAMDRGDLPEMINPDTVQ